MPIETIPIKFTHKGKDYEGHFQSAHGGGSDSSYQLMIANFYCGKFVKTLQGWQFYGNDPQWDDQELSELFENYFILWHC